MQHSHGLPGLIYCDTTKLENDANWPFCLPGLSLLKKKYQSNSSTILIFKAQKKLVLQFRTIKIAFWGKTVPEREVTELVTE